MKKICEGCGVKFEAKRATAKYHSDACRKAHKRGPVTAKPAKKKAKPKTGGQMVVSAVEARAVNGEPIDTGIGEIYGESSGLSEEEILAKNPFEKTDTESYDVGANLAAFRAMGLDPVEFITTGIPEFDALTRIPRGRVTQIQGPYAVGKTTLCLNMVRGLEGLRVLYIDTEASLNPQLLARLHINSATFKLWNESAFIEDVYDVILRALKEPQFDMIILDSLAACTFATEAAGDPTAANIGQKAKVVGKLMRVIPMELKRTKTALVIINQEREIIGAYGAQKYTPGGMGVPYASSLMVSLKTTKGARFPKAGPPFKGHEVTAEIIKSKVNDPWRKATFPIYYQGPHDEAA